MASSRMSLDRIATILCGGNLTPQQVADYALTGAQRAPGGR